MTLTYGTVDDPIDQAPAAYASAAAAPVTTRPSTSDSDRFSEQDTGNAAHHANGSNDEGGSAIEEDPEANATRKKARVKKIIIGLILLGIVIYIIVDSTTNRYVAQGIQIFLKWFEDNPVAGLFAFMGVYFLATVMFVPGSILTLGAGFVFANAFGLGWGVLLATVAVFCGAVAGDLTAFLLGRYLLRGWVLGWTDKYKIFKAIDKALETNGFRIMSLLRLSPVIPFNAINYIAGVTAISFSAYAWANLFILPGTILFCFLGATAGSLADSGASGGSGIITIVTIVVGVVFGVLAIVVVSFYAKKELNKILEEQNEEDSSTEPEGGDGGDIEAGPAEEVKDGESPGNTDSQRSDSQSTAAGSSSLSSTVEVEDGPAPS
uniref:VTT domain-containing protein n=1 Tax=Minutocellus polymorphus TaxID=265543 RepID=A0A6U4ITL6_9STRA|mmetsp:Transcript_3074/g.5231  ORF Transcript_3074/g.5231 Transcript_3074/m.5231 type:complete len:378 (+) Transcript_3074:145-1278(+)|eukprot:CAMPEP_0181032254 /NCGR_PEP_ID=MMETSP1070-20121207/6647_1 /TAXON_ID=265543 /ORGANISM="Minutocellus polymorphus, Strain NH13" /LENGTH=377 /DNA_ID=CAMNT_0023109645 /DNA_START=94 /DNA_END=1227 /DNA_ORIENTATION=+